MRNKNRKSVPVEERRRHQEVQKYVSKVRRDPGFAVSVFTRKTNKEQD